MPRPARSRGRTEDFLVVQKLLAENTALKALIEGQPTKSRGAVTRYGSVRCRQHCGLFLALTLPPPL
jgi:hypothetical protein